MLKKSPPKIAFKVKAFETQYMDKIMYGNIPMNHKLLSTDTENCLSVFVSSNNKKEFGPPLHVHYTFNDFFSLIEGTFEYKFDDEMMTLSVGDVLFIPRYEKHQFWRKRPLVLYKLPRNILFGNCNRKYQSGKA